MSLTLRRLIFYSSTIIFLVTAPLIIGYTAGYRYHFKQRRIVKTGGVFIATDPKGAAININESPRQETTPASILNLTPGEYQVRITKEGYWPWEKRLSVESERVTFADPVLLFKNESSELVAKDAVTDVAIMPRDYGAIFRSGDDAMNELWLVRGGDQNTILWRSTGTPRHIGPTNRAGAIVMTDGLTHAPVVVTTDKNTPPIDLGELVKPPFIKPLFDPSDNNVMYGITKGVLMSVNTKTRVVKPIAQRIRDYLPTKDGILVITESAIPKLGRIHNDAIVDLGILERGATELFEPIGSLQPYWDSVRGETILFETKPSDTPSTIRSVSGKIIAISSASDDIVLITATDHEIWRTILRSGRTELITRVSDPIVATYLHPTGTVIIYATTNRVRAVEVDDRNGRSILDLASNFETISAVSLSRDNTYLLIAGTIGGTQGLWRLSIR